MSSTGRDGGASTSTFSGQSEAIDLVAYNLFAKESLKPSSEIMTVFRNRGGIQPCDKCVKSGEICARGEGGAGVRCTFCSKRRLVCSWRADVLVPATALHYHMSPAEASKLYDRWAIAVQQRTGPFSNGDRTMVENTPGPVAFGNSDGTEGGQMLGNGGSMDLGIHGHRAGFQEHGEQMASVVSGPPSLARKANKLNGMHLHQAPPDPQPVLEAYTPPPPAAPAPAKRPRGRPRKVVKVEEVDDTEALRPKRAPKPATKAQVVPSAKKPSARAGTKRKQGEVEGNVDEAPEQPPKKMKGRPTKVKITIPARNSIRLRKITDSGTIAEEAPDIKPLMVSHPMASISSRSILTADEANLPNGLEERYSALEERYLKLCDIYAQSAIEGKAKDNALRQLAGTNRELENRLRELTVGSASAP